MNLTWRMDLDLSGTILLVLGDLFSAQIIYIKSPITLPRKTHRRAVQVFGNSSSPEPDKGPGKSLKDL